MSKGEERLESEGERERKWEARHWLRVQSALLRFELYLYLWVVVHGMP